VKPWGQSEFAGLDPQLSSTTAGDFTNSPNLWVQHPAESTAERFCEHSPSAWCCQAKPETTTRVKQVTSHPSNGVHATCMATDKPSTVSPSEMEEGAPASLAEQSYNDLFDY